MPLSIECSPKAIHLDDLQVEVERLDSNLVVDLRKLVVEAVAG